MRQRYKRKLDGFTVEVHGRTAGIVSFNQLGGGVAFELPALVFDLSYDLIQEIPFFAAAATLDGDENWYPCISNGNEWNGFGMPYFDRTTVELVAHDVLGDDRYHWDGQTLCYTDFDGDAGKITPKQINMNSEILTVWDLGAGSWTWAVKPVHDPFHTHNRDE